MTDAEGLLRRAAAAAGVHAPAEGSFREGLRVFVADLPAARLHPRGTAAVEAQLHEHLVNRLRIDAWLARHPEVLEQRVTSPIVVVGLPRTGTTLLSCLLGRDDRHRALMGWEAHDPLPPPEAATFATDPRVGARRDLTRALHDANPALAAMHFEDPDDPTECTTLLAQDLKSFLLVATANVPAYVEWLVACDHASAYRHHHRALQVLQSRAPGRWSLKSPDHALAVDALLAEYPDARLVMTHRDPVEAVASMCSLVRAWAGAFSDADHRDAVAESWTELLATCAERVMAFRDVHGDERFHDVAYDDLVADPLGVMRSIYGWLGEDLPPVAEAAMARYVDEHPQGSRGRHEYRLDDLRLDARRVTDRFAAYVERFGPRS
jgi:hypothetical protein